MVQLSHPYMTTGKTTALTIWTFVSKVMPLLFNVLSRFVIAFLPRNKCPLISRLQSPSAVILEPKKLKSVTVPTFSPHICHEVTGLDVMTLVFLNVEFEVSFYTLFFHFHPEALQFLFAFCRKDGVICISEVIDISPVLGSSPGGSREFEMGTASARIRKQLLN